MAKPLIHGIEWWFWEIPEMEDFLSKSDFYKKIKLQAMQDAPPLQLYPASDKFLMWNQRKAAKYL